MWEEISDVGAPDTLLEHAAAQLLGWWSRHVRSEGQQQKRRRSPAGGDVGAAGSFESAAVAEVRFLVRASESPGPFAWVGSVRAGQPPTARTVGAPALYGLSGVGVVGFLGNQFFLVGLHVLEPLPRLDRSNRLDRACWIG